jgi:hypothetical protein
VVQIVLNFWCSVVAVLPDQWAEPRRHMLVKGVGVYALIRIAADIVNECREGGRPCARRAFTAALDRRPRPDEAGLARVVRGSFLALTNEDFVTAARLDGGSELGITLRHMVPSFASACVRRSSPGACCCRRRRTSARSRPRPGCCCPGSPSS